MNLNEQRAAWAVAWAQTRAELIAERATYRSREFRDSVTADIRDAERHIATLADRVIHTAANRSATP